MGRSFFQVELAHAEKGGTGGFGHPYLFVDGIHFDDYFYPTTDPFVDEEQFAAAGLPAADRDKWRRQNVTALVQQVYAADLCGGIFESAGRSSGYAPGTKGKVCPHCFG